MTLPTDDHLLDLTAAIAGGRPVDWQAERQRARSRREARLIDQLELLARITEAHQRVGEQQENLPFTQWGALRLLEPIGSGSYGDVYRAREEPLHREVALKLYHAEWCADARMRATLLQEARNLARVSHENVVRVLGADVHHGRVGFWMEYQEGETLAARVARAGPLPADDVVRVGVQVCRGLEAIHGAGLVHGDLKASNVVMADAGHVRIVDLGAGRELAQGRESPSAPAQPDAPIRLEGTPLYMAPETLETGHVSERSDVFAVGVLLFHLATGRYPFEGDSVQTVRAAQAEGGRVGWDATGVEVPVPLREVVDRCLALEERARYKRAGQVARELQALLPDGSRGGTAGTPSPRSRRKTWLLSLGGLLAVGIVSTLALRTLATRDHLFVDEFDTVPLPHGDPNYEVFEFDPDLWHPDTLPGYLTLWTHQGDTWKENAVRKKTRNLVGHPYRGKHFQATTRVHDFWPRKDYQSACLIVFADQDNYVRMTINSGPTTVGDSLVQGQLFQCVYERRDEVFQHVEYPLLVNRQAELRPSRMRLASDGPIEDVWLRIIRDGDSWTALYSDDGNAYKILDTREFAVNTSYVGLAAFHGIGHRDVQDLTWDPIPAHFDMLRIEPLDTGRSWLGWLSDAGDQASAGTPGSLVQWESNGHCYEARLRPDGITWDEAQKECVEDGGHLVTLTSPEEIDFVFNLAKDPNLWILDVAQNWSLGPWIGGLQSPNSKEPRGGWRWVTGEPFTCTVWNVNQPDNYPAPNGPNTEDRIHLFAFSDAPAKLWNDHPHSNRLRGYVYEADKCWPSKPRRFSNIVRDVFP